MTIQQMILQEETEFPMLFADYEEHTWGILFYNEHAPDSYTNPHFKKEQMEGWTSQGAWTFSTIVRDYFKSGLVLR